MNRCGPVDPDRLLRHDASYSMSPIYIAMRSTCATMGSAFSKNNHFEVASNPHSVGVTACICIHTHTLQSCKQWKSIQVNVKHAQTRLKWQPGQGLQVEFHSVVVRQGNDFCSDHYQTWPCFVWVFLFFFCHIFQTETYPHWHRHTLSAASPVALFISL